MPIKVLLREKTELRLRFIGETHTSLQLIRERLSETKGVEYANYFPGHPDLDEPELYIRTSKGVDPEALIRKICSGITTEFESLSL